MSDSAAELRAEAARVARLERRRASRHFGFPVQPDEYTFTRDQLADALEGIRCGSSDCPHGRPPWGPTSMATAGGWVQCPHVSASGVADFACGICGPLTVHGAA